MTITSTKRPLRTLIVSAPGIMRDSLRALLASFPQIKIIGTADGCLTAHNMVKALSPDLVVVDANHPESEVVNLLQSLDASQCAPRSIIFANTPGQKEKLKKAGAGAVFLRSASLKPLTETLSRFYAAKQRAI